MKKKEIINNFTIGRLYRALAEIRDMEMVFNSCSYVVRMDAGRYYDLLNEIKAIIGRLKGTAESSLGTDLGTGNYGHP